MARIFICTDPALATLLDWSAAELASRGHEVVRGPVNETGASLSYDEKDTRDAVGDAAVAVFTGRHICSRRLMTAAPRLRGVCSPVIGVESIDMLAADELGIIVGYGAVPGNIVGMAEATIMLTLMLLFDVQANIRRMREGLWRRPYHASQQLAGKTLGFIGFGNIARAMACRLSPFGVRMLAHSPSNPADALPADVQAASLSSLLAESDVVCVLTSLTARTHKMIGAAELGLMKSTAYIVNTARGQLIDEEALYAHLRDRRIAGAALDTFAIEPLPVDSDLRTLDNVILTPHCVGHTTTAAGELGSALIENIDNILRGELPLYCRNPATAPAWRVRLSEIDGLVADRLRCVT